jgi:hypothetical protein
VAGIAADGLGADGIEGTLGCAPGVGRAPGAVMLVPAGAEGADKDGTGPGDIDALGRIAGDWPGDAIGAESAEAGANPAAGPAAGAVSAGV